MVCEGGTATFTCRVMFPNGTIPIGANWGTNNGLITIRANDVYDITDDSNGRSAPADVTTVLTVTNVTISDNGTDYVCTQGLITPAVSSVAFLTVVGKQINISYCLDYSWSCINAGSHLFARVYHAIT